MTAIRLAEGSDTEAVTAIVEEAYSPYIARMGQKPGPMLDDYAAIIADGVVHVCVRDAVVLGIVVLIAASDHLLLDNVAVAASARGLGIGGGLLAFAEAQAVQAGFRSIRLYTHETMVENIAIYTRRGYRITHRAEERGFRRVYMEKSLNAA